MAEVPQAPSDERLVQILENELADVPEHQRPALLALVEQDQRRLGDMVVVRSIRAYRAAQEKLRKVSRNF